MLKIENARAFIEYNFKPLDKKQGLLLILSTWLLSTFSLIGCEDYIQVDFVVAINILITIFLLFIVFKPLSFRYITTIAFGIIFTYLTLLFSTTSYKLFCQSLNHMAIVLIAILLILVVTILVTLYIVHRNIEKNKYTEGKNHNKKIASTIVSGVCLLGLVIYKGLSQFLNEKGFLLVLSTGMLICAILFAYGSVINIIKIVLYFRTLKTNQ